MPATHPLPEWITRLSYDYAFEPGSYSTSIDLTSNAAWKGEEIYFVCFSSLEDSIERLRSGQGKMNNGAV